MNVYMTEYSIGTISSNSSVEKWLDPDNKSSITLMGIVGYNITSTTTPKLTVLALEGYGSSAQIHLILRNNNSASYSGVTIAISYLTYYN